MSDPVIKLFGKTISWPQKHKVSCNNEPSDTDVTVAFAFAETCSDDQKLISSSITSRHQDKSSREGNRQDDDDDRNKGSSSKEVTLENGNVSDPTGEYIKSDPTTSSVGSRNPKTPSIQKEISLKTSSKSSSEEQSESNTISEEKNLKKPDKILPCPRCNSMETKFSYFNNYNVKQPRHFCKNCQRYWTSGGTMRNVPVGSGRRKNNNKSHSASQYHHILMCNPLQTARASGSNGSAVVNFGSETSLFESMSEREQNGYPRPDHSNGSSYFTASTSSDGEFAPQLVPNYPLHPWPYNWSSAQWTSTMPVSFYPPLPYWGYNNNNVPAASWNITCVPSHSCTINNPSSSSSGPNSQTLGKHCRDGKSNTGERSIPLIPKTLRIDDSSESAKSSTLGIKNDKLRRSS